MELRIVNVMMTIRPVLYVLQYFIFIIRYPNENYTRQPSHFYKSIPRINPVFPLLLMYNL